MFSDFSATASERIVLRQNSESSGELSEEIVAVLAHFGGVRPSSGIRQQALIDEKESLVFHQDFEIIVVQFHGRHAIVACVDDVVGVRIGGRASAFQVHSVLGIETRVDLGVKPLNQIHTVGSAHTMCSCTNN